MSSMVARARDLSWKGLPEFSEERASADVSAAQERLRTALKEDLFSKAKHQDAVRAAIDEPLASQYLTRRHAAHLFIACELDTDSPGKRGLGRSSEKVWPRLGGQFRAKLPSDAKLRLAVPMHQLVASGWVVGAALNPLRNEGPFRLKSRSEGETIEVLVPQIVNALNDEHGIGLMLADMAGGPPMEDFIEVSRGLGLLGGFRKAKKEDELVGLGALYLSCGVALYDTQTTRWDDEDLRFRTISGFGSA